MIVGIDVGGTKASALLVDAGSVAVVDRERTSSVGDGPTLVTALAALVTALRDRSPGPVAAVGLGIAGLADRAGTVTWSPNLPGAVGYPVGPELERAVGLPVTVGNDSTAATLAEAKFGAGQGCDDLAMVTLGTGIGGGFVLGGRLQWGAHGFSGEPGHMMVDGSGPVHLTGHRGPWEYYASGNALGRLGSEAAASGAFNRGLIRAGSPDAVTGYHVVEALADGDLEATAVFNRWCVEVARGVANLIVVLDVSRVVLGGGLAEVGEPLRDGVAKALVGLLPGAGARPPVDVVLARLGPDAGAIGAALLTVDLP
jgi:glucokinase